MSNIPDNIMKKIEKMAGDSMSGRSMPFKDWMELVVMMQESFSQADRPRVAQMAPATCNSSVPSEQESRQPILDDYADGLMIQGRVFSNGYRNAIIAYCRNMVHGNGPGRWNAVGGGNNGDFPVQTVPSDSKKHDHYNYANHGPIRKIMIVKIIREKTQMSLREAKDMIESKRFVDAFKDCHIH